MEIPGKQQTIPCRVGMATVLPQQWGELYDLKTAMKTGTIFKELDMPFFKGGAEVGK